MKKKIIFQGCNFNYIYFLLYMVSYIIMVIIDYFLDPNKFVKKEEINFKHYISKEILDIHSFNLSDLIAIIPYFIRKKLSKNNNEIKKEEKNNNDKNDENGENNELKENEELIYNETKISETNNKLKKILFYLILIGVFDFLKQFVFISYYLIFKHKFYYVLFPFNYTVVLDIILQFVCSYFILRIHFYKLQHFSLYLNVVIFIIILTLDLVDILIFKNIKWHIYLLYPIFLTFFCLEYVYRKKVILFGYLSIYISIIAKGAIKLVFVIIFSLFVFIFDKEIFLSFLLYFKDTKRILLIIAKIITNFFTELSMWIIIDRFSPNYTPLIIIGEEICNFVGDLIITKNFFILKDHKYIRIVLYIISFIGVILHNEIVVINICGLGSDTKYFYDVLVKNEEEYSNADDPDILKKFETIDNNEYKDNDSATSGSEN